jgi:hypothetical protein
VWVLIAVAVTFTRSGWALFGPAPDLDAVERRLDARGRQRAEQRERHSERRAERRGRGRDR